MPPAVSYDTAPRPSRHLTLAHRLKGMGYSTGMVGLWHLGLPEPVSAKRDLKKVDETPASKIATAAGGKVQMTITCTCICMHVQYTCTSDR